MRIYIIGVGTTFMTGLAVLARHAGHDVTGSDSCFDLPTRKQLNEAGVVMKQGFSANHLAEAPELVIVGNEVSSRNEELLEARRQAIPYISGSLWLEEYILHDRWAKSMPPNFGSESNKEKSKSSAPPRPSRFNDEKNNSPKAPHSHTESEHKIPHRIIR